MNMNEAADIVVIGGGAMGSAAAYFLMTLGGPGLQVIVCEPDPSYAQSSTLNAAGGIRLTFSISENIEMSRFGAEFLELMPILLAVGDVQPAASFDRKPYLHLVSGEVEVGRLRQSALARGAAQVPASWLDRRMLATRFPWMNVEDVAAGLLGEGHEGTFDPESLLRALRNKAISLGASYRRARAVALDSTGTSVNGVLLNTGESISCGLVINAAGPNAADVAALAQCDVPIVRREATTFIFQATKPTAYTPIIIDRIQGLNVRSEGDRFLASKTHLLPSLDQSQDGFDAFTDVLWPALAHRTKAFEAIKFAGSWNGFIDASPADGNPFIGPHPSLDNFFLLAGFNGHGLQHAPAAGRAIAELALYKRYRSIDLRRFGFRRSGELPPIKEHF